MDNFNPTLISIVMPCHNAAPYVEEAISSVLGQSYPHVELIVVDDGSTDGSTEILQRLAAGHPERLTLIYQNRAGPFVARNQALGHANGNYIAFLDADDTWHPDALRLMHDALIAANADLAYCSWQKIGVASTDPNPIVPPDFESNEAVAYFLEHTPWPINSVLIARHLIDELRGFSERAPTAMDYDLWLRMLARRPRLVRIPDVLAFYRLYPRGNAHIPHWQQVFDAVAVRHDLARHHPELVARFTPAHLNELIYGPLLREAYRSHWRNDTESARRLFRRAFRKADWKAGDFKHLVASLLPAPLYRNLVDRVTRRRSVRIGG
ncbi:MAG: glycosyltransferase [Thiobacillus sp.]|nr:glycosyltransferase [Thiobacillus sp.]